MFSAWFEKRRMRKRQAAFDRDTELWMVLSKLGVEMGMPETLDLIKAWARAGDLPEDCALDFCELVTKRLKQYRQLGVFDLSKAGRQASPAEDRPGGGSKQPRRVSATAGPDNPEPKPKKPEPRPEAQEADKALQALGVPAKQRKAIIDDNPELDAAELVAAALKART